MGNKKGSLRFTEQEKLLLLNIVKNILPTGAKEWAQVGHFYMAGRKKTVEEENEAIRLATGTKGTKTVYERTVKSLNNAYRTMRKSKVSTGIAANSLTYTKYKSTIKSILLYY